MNNRATVERIMQIIAFVIAAEDTPGTETTSALVKELEQQGFSESEIATAMSWIIERKSFILSAKNKPKAKITSFRAFSAFEREIIQKEAWGLLMRYQQVGFLSHADIEQIIERAIILGVEGGLGTQEVKAILAAYFIGETDPDTSGSRSILQGDDSVN
jgi:uncharacterized protein Smg (DUF494 family)